MQDLVMAEIVRSSDKNVWLPQTSYSHLSQQRLLGNRNLHGVSTLVMM